jgi:isochorismate synthase
VNLRCAEITPGNINLYVGGGLTADSNPEKEWEETELKAQTLLAVINQENKT